MRPPLCCLLLLLLCAVHPLMAGGSVVPVGEYLYADPALLPEASGSLQVRFGTPSAARLVIALGRRYRKDRREGEVGAPPEREAGKPHRATMQEEGRLAEFTRLPPDYYDLVVIDPAAMTWFEGLALYQPEPGEECPPELLPAYQAELERSFISAAPGQGRPGGWEGFFDTAELTRFTVSRERGGILLQQMRLGVALAESGEHLKGCIHSLDIVWVERASQAEAGWQVATRQQLYRDELPARTFFRHRFVPELQGVRIGSRLKTLDLTSLEP